MKFQTHAAKQIAAYKRQAEFRSSVPYPAQPKEKLTVGGLEIDRPLVITGQGDYRRGWTPDLAETDRYKPGMLDFALLALVVVAFVIAAYAIVAILIPMAISAL